MSKMNNSRLYDWMLVRHKRPSPRKPPDEYFTPYFVLPTAEVVQLLGRTENDSRANEETTAFIDGHRLLTGNLLALETKVAVTGRTVYELEDMHPLYRAWLEEQGWGGSFSVRYSIQPGDKILEEAQDFISTWLTK